MEQEPEEELLKEESVSYGNAKFGMCLVGDVVGRFCSSGSPWPRSLYGVRLNNLVFPESDGLHGWSKHLYVALASSRTLWKQSERIYMAGLGCQLVFTPFESGVTQTAGGLHLLEYLVLGVNSLEPILPEMFDRFVAAWVRSRGEVVSSRRCLRISLGASDESS